MERAGIDIITDGEARRESYSNHFSNALAGIDGNNPATIAGRSGQPVQVPRVTGPVRRIRPVEVGAVKFLRDNTDRTIKMTVPGPFTMSRQARNEHYREEEDLALDLATAVNEELLALKAAGADIVQIDEPWMQTAPEAAKRYGVAALDRALDNVPGPTVVHMCFGYAQFVGDKAGSGYGFPGAARRFTGRADLDRGRRAAARPRRALRSVPTRRSFSASLTSAMRPPRRRRSVAGRIRAGLQRIPAERLIPAPDCGMKYLPRPLAFAKLKALAEGAAIVRHELGRA